MSNQEVVVVGFMTAEESKVKGGRGSYWYANSLDGERLNTAASRQDLVNQLDEFEVVDVDEVEYRKQEFSYTPDAADEEEEAADDDFLFDEDEE